VTKQVKQLDRVIIRFAGDSGDGMQLTGDRFTQETAAFGNDLSTLPNFPAEIRAPARCPASRRSSSTSPTMTS
jgi:2-oxoglutarate/2-oxoacid ferredoxin oxidoreductase subunit alpha